MKKGAMLDKTKKTLELMINLYQSGNNKEQIAAKLGCSSSYVYKVMSKAGYCFKGRTRKGSENSDGFDSYMINFGIFLTYCKEKVLRISDKTMAIKLGVSTYKLHQLEKGLIKLYFTEWLKYVKLLEVNPSTVLDLIQKENLEEILLNKK